MTRRTILLSAFGLSALLASAQKYDFIVPENGNFRQAIEAANNRTDTLSRFRIFVRKGTHVTPVKGMTRGGDGKEYGDPRTNLSAPNVSIIGEAREATVVTNIVPEPTWDNGFGQANPLEGIGRGDVLIIERTAHDTYLQDITIRSAMADHTGRNIALHDRSDKTVMKNVCLWGYQDTYVSNNQNGRFYFEGGVIRGRTDYICGKGDVLYQGVTFQQCDRGGYLAVPSVPRKYGYVMKSCYIKSETPDVSYYLGRPWGKGTPRAVWIDTKVDSAPICKGEALGWADMSGGWPALFTEYNTVFANGDKVDVSSRRSVYRDREGNLHSNAPVLTKKQTADFTIENVMGAEDGWNPTETARQIAVDGLRLAGKRLVWDEAEGAFLYSVSLNGKVLGFSRSTSFRLPRNLRKTDVVEVRAANAMGGLGTPAVIKK